MPEVSEQELNRTIKELGERLSAKVPSLAKKERTILKLQEKRAEQKARAEGKELFEYDKQGYVVKPRWQLITSHTARRSCITNMYLSGRFSKDEMMGVSGHKTEKQFLEYVKLSLDEKADLVAKSSANGLF